MSVGDIRILLGDNTGGRAVMLWPITAHWDADGYQLDSFVHTNKVLYFPAWPTGAGPTLQSVLIDFLKVIITAIVCLAAAVDC